MSDDTQRWKDKYLQSLEEQEALERRWQERLDLLRRSLVRSSLAAEGLDRAVDTCMRELREVIRQDDMTPGLQALMPRLEKTLLAAEQRRHDGQTRLTAALEALLRQLLELPLPGELRKPLKRLAKSLSGGLESAELPTLLAELSELQGQALATLELPARPGLLGRLFGGGATQAAEEVPAVADEPDESPAGTAEASPQAPVPIPTPTPSMAVAESRPRPLFTAQPLLDTLPAPAEILPRGEVVNAALDSYELDEPGETGFGSIAGHIETTLLGLLNALKITEQQAAQAEALRERISRGLNLYELVTVLDDLVGLLQACAQRSGHDFEGYLQRLNERLAQFQEGLLSAHEGHAEARDEARRLDQQLRDEVGGLHTDVSQATELGALKQLVEGRIEGLLQSLEQQRNQREQRDREVAERLQALASRVEAMEQEARGFQEHLETERRKAQVDSLTGLPNRAAWNERLELEVARWRRYGGELLLAVLDVDLFKGINDRFGHLAGDKVLRLIAAELARRLRKTDFIARYGGEEFVVLLPSTPLDGGQQVLEALRRAVEACPFHFRGERVTITVSIGLAAFQAEEAPEQVFERADQALYRAKREGRNRLCLAEPAQAAAAPVR